MGDDVVMRFARHYLTALPVWALVAAVSCAIGALAGFGSGVTVILVIVIAPAVTATLAVRRHLR